jgi:hypothetical protein
MDWVMQLMKNLPHESPEDLIKKYDESFPKLAGRGQDTIILGRVLEFGGYCKRIIPTLEVRLRILRTSRRWH